MKKFDDCIQNLFNYFNKYNINVVINIYVLVFGLLASIFSSLVMAILFLDFSDMRTISIMLLFFALGLSIGLVLLSINTIISLFKISKLVNDGLDSESAKKDLAIQEKNLPSYKCFLNLNIWLSIFFIIEIICMIVFMITNNV